MSKCSFKINISLEGEKNEEVARKTAALAVGDQEVKRVAGKLNEHRSLCETERLMLSLSGIVVPENHKKELLPEVIESAYRLNEWNVTVAAVLVLVAHDGGEILDERLGKIDNGDRSEVGFFHDFKTLFDGKEAEYFVPLFPPYLNAGSTNAAVKWFQAILISHFQGKPGFECVDDLVADGIYGPQTVACVKALQKYLGLEEDGNLGPNTRLAWSELADGCAVNVDEIAWSEGQVTNWAGPDHEGLLLWPVFDEEELSEVA